MSNIVAFEARIKAFNEMYKMPTIISWVSMIERLPNFKKILEEEYAELKDIEDQLNLSTDTNADEMKAAALVMMSDLLGDIIVYCASEAVRWNIPIGDVLSIIMDSNFSKLGADGLPIYDERGKLMKGPNYYKPEPKIKELLEKQNG